MTLRIPIGVDDFRKLRERRLTYVDKSHLVCEILDKVGTEVLLLPRPRRFGKSVNLSMLRCFFEKSGDDLSPIFEGLHVWQAGDPYREHFQRYPVIYLSLKDTKQSRFEDCWETIRNKIRALFHEHRALLDGGNLSEYESRDYRAILDGTASRALYERSLLDLSQHLHGRHGERVVVLIDEYDEPIHGGYANGYASEIVGVCRNLLGAGLKGNPHLFKAVLTGILRVARESIFSGLNNVAAYSLLRTEFSTCFGFTEPEVEALLRDGDAAERIEDVRRAYNGYVFGNAVVYNPWSVLSFLASEDRRTVGHWVSTSANEMIRDLLIYHALDVRRDIEALLEGGSIERRIDENVVLQSLPADQDALWSLLVFAGYLRAEARPAPLDQALIYRLSIPNGEVREVYTTTFRTWMQARLTGRGASVERLIKALLGGDAAMLEEQLQAFVTNVLSYHDARRLGPEEIYHGFVAGLLATLEPDYDVRSNRESGDGRPDVLVRPRQAGKPGAALELKVARAGRSLQRALTEGIRQVRDNDYLAELRAGGASPAHAFAVAFDGKQVRVRAVEGARAAKTKSAAASRATKTRPTKPATRKPATKKRAAR